jgi:hypothetical protein
VPAIYSGPVLLLAAIALRHGLTPASALRGFQVNVTASIERSGPQPG